jgi:hypothetical protein
MSSLIKNILYIFLVICLILATVLIWWLFSQPPGGWFLQFDTSEEVTNGILQSLMIDTSSRSDVEIFIVEHFYGGDSCISTNDVISCSALAETGRRLSLITQGYEILFYFQDDILISIFVDEAISGPGY